MKCPHARIHRTHSRFITSTPNSSPLSLSQLKCSRQDLSHLHTSSSPASFSLSRALWHIPSRSKVHKSQPTCYRLQTGTRNLDTLYQPGLGWVVDCVRARPEQRFPAFLSQAPRSAVVSQHRNLVVRLRSSGRASSHGSCVLQPTPAKML